jgi:low affinity sulfate transporter 2
MILLLNIFKIYDSNNFRNFCFIDLMNVDTSGILALEELHKRLLSRGVEVSLPWLFILYGPNTFTLSLIFKFREYIKPLCTNTYAIWFLQLAMVNPRWLVIHKLKLAHFVDKIGKQWVFLTVGEAVDACLASKVATAWCRLSMYLRQFWHCYIFNA